MSEDPYVRADARTMQVVLLVDGVKHLGIQLRANGEMSHGEPRLDDEKDGVIRAYCETMEALANPILEPTETYDIADLIEGTPNCVACLAKVP